MLPAFDDHGYLPPGIHPCAIEELAERFGTGSAEREAGFEDLKRYVVFAQSQGIIRLLVAGSFVTGKLRPRDVDLIVLPPDDYDPDTMTLELDPTQWPSLHIVLATDDKDLLDWIELLYSQDRKGQNRGLVEVIR